MKFVQDLVRLHVRLPKVVWFTNRPYFVRLHVPTSLNVDGSANFVHSAVASRVEWEGFCFFVKNEGLKNK